MPVRVSLRSSQPASAQPMRQAIDEVRRKARALRPHIGHAVFAGLGRWVMLRHRPGS